MELFNKTARPPQDHKHQNDKRRSSSPLIPTLLILLTVLLITVSGCQKPEAPAVPEEPVPVSEGEGGPSAEKEEEPETPEAQPVHDPMDNPQFGYGDQQGIFALMLSDPKTLQPEVYTHLSLPDGTTAKISYEGIQPPGPNDNLMDISANFKQRYGAVYRLNAGKIPENDSVTLMTDAFVSARTFHALTKVGESSSDQALRQRIEADRKLTVKNLWHLYDAENSAAIYLAQFEPQGNQAMLTLILVDPAGALWYAYFPANYIKELDLYSWRVDDGGEIHPENFIVGWLADFGKRPELALYWRGAEGELLHWLTGENGGLTKSREGYRYWGAY
ncbi:hypothetical protein [Acidaminobacter hydrogenoformans]|uniref:Uncharacterized protein n=1 Tax=Acidaminobacter hydrogenoformans DSM 2784 TaxID=1120920 RepID=A0A1G5S6E7_9FIRM|nr:hypothetical protein [Acidaminobacter hydrogenoformans]SCZ81935.1 hypothetical protein SAMN03080599_03183 [Acidaminobacter hydrogenoformans DSM 2784]